ncbi:MAG: BamA/TamA family outer membrane protein [Cyclonatronaceae bacterium]
MNTSTVCRPVLTLLFIAVLTSLAAPALHAQQFGRNKIQYETFDFKEIDTEHFRILYYPDKRPFIPQVARMAERWYDRLARVTNHQFAEGERKPLIFYADDADFRQTNIVPGFIPGGVRGLTEPVQDRLVMPFAADHSVTHQVLGHELVHAFQFDYAGQTGINAQRLPLWLVEGMSEYYAVGRRHTETAMWMRDAVISDKLPDFDDFARQQRYNPYRFGHAFLAFLGGSFGDESIIQYFRGVDSYGPRAAVDSLYQMPSGELMEAWHDALRQHYEPLIEDRTPADETGRVVLSAEQGHGRINLAPSLSPDGKYVAFLTNSFPMGIDLKIARSETGEVIGNLGSVHKDPHLDDIRFLTSGGSWNPGSDRVAFITFAKGNNEIAIWDLGAEQIERSVRLRGVPALQNPAWSPDGRHIAVSGIVGGRSNLYLYDLEEDRVEQLTDDAFTALQPQWSPEGQTLVYTTDGGPGGTDMDRLDMRPNRIALLDTETGNTTHLSPLDETNYSNPHFSPDGGSLYFIAAPDGFLDIFRHDLRSEQTYRLTRTQTGITGVTVQSPALTVSRETGEMMFSIFTGNKYKIAAIDPDPDKEEPMEGRQADPDAPAGILPPYDALDQNIVAGYLADPDFGLLPPDRDFDMEDHSRTLRLVGLMPPQIGVGIGGIGGTQAAGGAGLLFSDLLNDRDLAVALGFEVRGEFWDISGMSRFINRRHRINYGGSLQRVPQSFARAFSTVDEETGQPQLNRMVERVTINQANILGEYPLSTTTRLESTAGVSLYTFERWVETYSLGRGGLFGDREIEEQEARDDIYFGSTSLAYVLDTSYMGFTGPIQGRRFRVQATPLVGSVRFARFLADYRRYLFFDPLTLAGRIAHFGNYGSDIDEPFSTVYLGYPNSQTFVRGYDFFSFRPDEFSQDNQNYSPINRLVGTHAAVASVELRFPLLGTERHGLFRTRLIPTEIAVFVDGGVAWTSDDPPVFRLETDSEERIPVFSTGVSARINLAGALVLEFYLAHPFQRPERNTQFGLQFIPGW